MNPDKGDSTRSQTSQVVSHTVLTRSHMSLCRNICACDCRTDDQTTTDYPSGDVLTQEPSTFECSLASGFDVDANSMMVKSSAGSRGSVEKTCPAVPCPRYPSSLASRYGLVAANVFQDCANRVTRTPGSSSQSVGINGRMRRERRRIWHNHRFSPTAAASAQREAKTEVKT